MMANKIIQSVGEKVQIDVIETLRRLTDRACAGEIIGIAGIAELPGGSYEIIGSKTLSRLQTAGALLDAACTRLNE